MGCVFAVHHYFLEFKASLHRQGAAAPFLKKEKIVYTFIMKSCTLVVMRAGAVRLQQHAGERLQRWRRGGILIPVCRLCSRGFPGLSSLSLFLLHSHPLSQPPTLPLFSAVFSGASLVVPAACSQPPAPAPPLPVAQSAQSRATPPLLHLHTSILQDVHGMRQQTLLQELK